MKRIDGRKPDELRPVKVVRHFTRFAPGSILIDSGLTRVLCTACFEQAVPPWRKGSGKGWLSAEYGMLPTSNPDRKKRSEGRTDGRSQEIQRLIGRALRAIVDMDQLGENTIWIDCDVLQADGGTRTASINGSYIALVDAINYAMTKGILKKNPLTGSIGAVSAGVVDGRVLLDLNYSEDSAAQVDFNVVMTGKGELVEVQGTAEHGTFSQKQLADIIAVCKKGIGKILNIQKQSLRSVVS
ncbi:MAG: ribonuclease PH [Phycisphaerae bacterium]